MFNDDPLLKQMFHGDDNTFLEGIETDWINADSICRATVPFERQNTAKGSSWAEPVRSAATVRLWRSLRITTPSLNRRIRRMAHTWHSGTPIERIRSTVRGGSERVEILSECGL